MIETVLYLPHSAYIFSMVATFVRNLAVALSIA